VFQVRDARADNLLCGPCDRLPFLFGGDGGADGVNAEYAREFVRRGIDIRLGKAENKDASLFAHDVCGQRPERKLDAPHQAALKIRPVEAF